MTISYDIPEGMHLEFDNTERFHNIAILNASGQWRDDYGNELVIGTNGIKGTVYDHPFVRLVPESVDAARGDDHVA